MTKLQATAKTIITPNAIPDPTKLVTGTGL